MLESIAVNNRIQNVVANHFGSALVRFLVLPIRPSTIIVKAGRPTAVTKKPLIADVNDVPASKPIAGGKIKLPAPRNSAKVIRPIASKSCVFKCCTCIV